MTDSEWEVLGPEAEALMAELRRGRDGRPMSHDPRAMVDAIGYVTKYAVQWRALPVDFPPWEAVYAFFERWNARGLPDRLVVRLRGRLRVAMGRRELPTACSIDSQSVKAADTVGAASRGFRWRESCRTGSCAGCAGWGCWRRSSGGVAPVKRPA